MLRSWTFQDIDNSLKIFHVGKTHDACKWRVENTYLTLPNPFREWYYRLDHWTDLHEGFLKRRDLARGRVFWESRFHQTSFRGPKPPNAPATSKRLMIDGNCRGTRIENHDRSVD
jgi:hypothetical protein